MIIVGGFIVALLWIWWTSDDASDDGCDDGGF